MINSELLFEGFLQKIVDRRSKIDYSYKEVNEENFEEIMNLIAENIFTVDECYNEIYLIYLNDQSLFADGYNFEKFTELYSEFISNFYELIGKVYSYLPASYFNPKSPLKKYVTSILKYDFKSDEIKLLKKKESDLIEIHRKMQKNDECSYSELLQSGFEILTIRHEISQKFGYDKYCDYIVNLLGVSLESKNRLIDLINYLVSDAMKSDNSEMTALCKAKKLFIANKKRSSKKELLLVIEHLLQKISDKRFSDFRNVKNLTEFDVLEAPKKISTSLTISYPLSKKYVIFSKPRDTFEDIKILCHEVGHLLHFYKSSSLNNLFLMIPDRNVSELIGLTIENISVQESQQIFGSDNYSKILHNHALKIYDSMLGLSEILFHHDHFLPINSLLLKEIENDKIEKMLRSKYFILDPLSTANYLIALLASVRMRKRYTVEKFNTIHLIDTIMGYGKTKSFEEVCNEIHLNAIPSLDELKQIFEFLETKLFKN